MARIRTIKPEFWTSEQVMECSPTARLLFIGIWNFSDDAGNHPASAKTLKAEVFPSDDISSSEVQTLVNELIANGLLIEYSASGKDYLHVSGWNHQKIEKPTYKHPSFENRQPVEDRAQEKPAKSGTDSTTIRRPFDDHSTTEGSVMEGNGKEGNTHSTFAHEEISPPVIENQPTPAATRKGQLCRQLRDIGVDAAPHKLDESNWVTILAKRTDEEILGFAESVMAKKPGERIALGYLAKGLIEDPKPIPITATIHRRQPMSAADRVRAANPLPGDEINQRSVIEVVS